eukprot:TRINITY_DN28207_c0_g1_i2.p1 TRINITY_DN28207_c0_g1~~TRINITY_DN28207_c0_g1_i2.p1  ORF type:complete len:274 (-),score=-0.31 TRINITY_DN28207_c0_g1_i2:33-779(-)
MRPLTDLKLTNVSGLTALPAQFVSLCCLKKLELDECYDLTTLPEGFGSLTSLEELTLNYLTNLTGPLPLSFAQLPALQVLIVGGSVPQIPPAAEVAAADGGTSQAEFPSLRRVELTQLPDSTADANLEAFFYPISHVPYLQISYCQFARFPDCLHLLPSLRHLALLNLNQLQEVPPSVGSLSALTRLAVKECQRLAVLPDSVTTLEQLQELELVNLPRLHTRPIVCRNFAHLEVIRVEMCPLVIFRWE